MINNGERKHLIIAGVFDGQAGVQGDKLAFLPNRTGTNPGSVRGGLLNGEPVLLSATKDPVGPFWTARFKVIE